MHLLPSRRDDFLFPIEAHFNKIFDQFLTGSSLKDSLKATQGYPKMDMYEDGESLTVKVAVPGLKLEDLSVDLDRSKGLAELTIAGKLSEVSKSKASAFYVKELRQSAFKRTVALPDYVKDDPDAVLEDGILTLRWDLPERQKDVEIKRITIKQKPK